MGKLGEEKEGIGAGDMLWPARPGSEVLQGWVRAWEWEVTGGGHHQNWDRGMQVPNDEGAFILCQNP